VCSTLAVSACTTSQGAIVGGVTGAAVGGLATNSVGGAILGAGVGALAGAILVESTNGRCTYRYKGRLYHERCR
jgi:outer membrane lipoprotein SlyB